MDTRIQGNWFDGRHATPQAAVLCVTPAGDLQLEPPLLPSCHWKDVKISARLGNTPRYFHFADGSLFETRDNDVVDGWLQSLLVGDGGHPLQHDRVQSWVHRLESHWPTVLGSVVLTLLLSVWFAVYGAPQVAQWTADRLPPSASAYVGQDTLAVLDRTVFQPSQLDSARQQQLQVVFAGLLPEDQEGLHYRLLFRGGGKIGANAFALPDASIVMTDELVKLAENDAQLAVIFLHEIGHVRGRHLLRQVIQQAGLAALLVTITGDISGASSMVLAMPGVLMQAQYSQSMEYEADTYALEHLSAHGLSPLAFAQIMRRMDSERESFAGQPEKTGESPEVGTTETETEEKDTFGQYWSSHPATAERINRFEQAAGQH